MDLAQIAQIALALAAGVGLSASCGFRVFVPPLILSLASMAGFVNLGDDFAWVGTWQAALAFGAAAVIEIAAYYVPALDNLLDTISAPLSAVAGLGITAALLGSDVSPAVRWILAVIAGGGTAFVTSTATAGVRAVSTTTDPMTYYAWAEANCGLDTASETYVDDLAAYMNTDAAVL